MDIDHAAMAAASNIWRAAQTMRTHLERQVLRDDDLAGRLLTAVQPLGWGAMETRALAASMGVDPRDGVSGVCDTLERRGLVERAGQRPRPPARPARADPRRLRADRGVFPASTPASPRCAPACPAEQENLADLLRRVVLTVKEAEAGD